MKKSQKPMKLLRQNVSLTRRIVQRREENVDLMLENAELKEKLAVYEQFFGAEANLFVTDMITERNQNIIDIFIRFDPINHITEYKTFEGGQMTSIPMFKMLGILEVTKGLMQEGFYNEYDYEDFDIEDEEE
jgi:regulator of replication initiation timing